MGFATTSPAGKTHNAGSVPSQLTGQKADLRQGDTSAHGDEKWSDQRIEEFWAEQARVHGIKPDASWSDIPVLEMEFREIVARINDGDKILDVGCANGFTTLKLARSRSVDLTGVDYIPEMVQNARTALKELRSSLRGQVRFDLGNVLALPFPESAFDKVISIRVIINLGKWEQQVAGLTECARVLKPGGVLILSEATLQGWNRLNQFRQEWNLPPIPMPHFNNYLDQELVQQALQDSCDLVEITNFASSYYVGSRVLKPLIAKLTGREDQIPNTLTEWNRWFSLLPAIGDYGTQKMFVFRKKPS